MSNDPSTTTSRRDLALSIVRTLQEAGHTAYFAGGCVRDELLGLQPKDYDVATDATPARIAALFPKTQEVGAAFGVMIVKSRRDMVEVATFRADGPYSDRRRPDSVTFSDPRTDAQRRDFTINALFCDPTLPYEPDPTVGLRGVASGKIIDFVGGTADLAQGVLRTVGDPDRRFAEDDLRVLRAIRFAARFALSIDPATGDAIRRHAGALAGISRERVGEELRKMLLHPSRAQAAALLAAHNLVEPTLGPLDRSAPRRSDFPILQNTQAKELGTFLAAWLLDLGLPVQPIDFLSPKRTDKGIPHREATGVLRRTLCLSNTELHQLTTALEGSVWIEAEWSHQGMARQKRAAHSEWFSEALHLVRAQRPAAATAIEQRLAELQRTPGGLHPTPLLTGDDLIAAGFTPGPSFKGLIDRVYDDQLEGKLSSPQEAMELARRLSVSS